jgi:hypothetical protein
VGVNVVAAATEDDFGGTTAGGAAAATAELLELADGVGATLVDSALAIPVLPCVLRRLSR